MADIGTFAGIGLALYAAHHVGDYWVQTDWQSANKGKPGMIGSIACLRHVGSYVLTQAVFLVLTLTATGTEVPVWKLALALFVSGVTHYAADRREFGIMLRLARLIPGKERFVRLGVPRPERDDSPCLGTGAWALDQSWHIALGVFVPALIACL